MTTTDAIYHTQSNSQSPRPPNGALGAGVSSGAHIASGENDDGWIIPPPVRLTDGTHLQLFKDGEAWHAALRALKAAAFRICLEVYIFADDDLGRTVAELLCQKAREGAHVYVIYDSFGSMETDPALFKTMQRAGVRVQQFHPIRPWECRYGWRAINRDHRKLLVIDNHIGGLGGINLGREYAGSSLVGTKLLKSKGVDCEQWRDNAIGISGPATLQLMRSFARTWNYVLHGGRIRRAELIHDIYDGEFGLLASVPTLDSPLQPALCRFLRSAKKSILLTMAYFAPGDVLVDELCKAADRGVRVQLMLPGRGDVKLLVLAARSFYDRLMSHGIEIYERQHVVLHAKAMVVDDCATIIGSTNLDYRSIEYNCELSATIRSAEFGQQMRALFENDIRYAKRVDPDIWRRRPYWDRVGQWAVSRARYLL